MVTEERKLSTLSELKAELSGTVEFGIGVGVYDFRGFPAEQARCCVASQERQAAR